MLEEMVEAWNWLFFSVAFSVLKDSEVASYPLWFSELLFELMMKVVLVLKQMQVIYFLALVWSFFLQLTDSQGP